MPSEPAHGARLSALHALALGALHGPAELLPISSSGHVTLVPWLLGCSDGDDGDDELRKAFEVALHTGTAAALLIGLRAEVGATLRGMTPALAGRLAVATLPAAIVGYTLEDPIERHLGTPATIAAGLIAGSLALLRADRCPRTRTSAQAGTADALWLGVAQACALVPGVSRNGATLAAARWRRFARPDANRLSRHVALPVIAGATALKSLRLARRGLPPRTARPLALGAAASFASTLASTRLIAVLERDRPLAPYAAYRLVLAAVVLGRVATSAPDPAGRSARSATITV